MPKDGVNSDRLAARAITFSRAAAASVFLLGALVIIGWLLDLEGLKQIYGEITMKTNAAVCLMLTAFSIWNIPRPEEKVISRLGLVCCVVAGLIGIATLSQHLLGWNLHIDQLLATERPGALATTSPNRMGITSASCFTLFSIALVFLYRRWSISVAQGLSLIAGFWALLAVIGYAYNAEALFGVARYTGIAFPTAVALTVISVSILAASLHEGVFSVIIDDGAAGIMSRRLISIALIVPFSVGWLRLAGQRAGFYDLGFGTSLLVSLIVLTFFLAIWRVAVELKHLDEQRKLTEEIARQERLKAERAQALLAGIVQYSDDAIISKSLDGIIDSWNEGAEKLFEFAAAEAVGKPITLIIPPERLTEEQMIISRLKRGERVEHFETVRVSKSGRRIDISLSISPVLNEHGEIVGASKIARDITDRRNVERERERLLLRERSLRAEAERATRMKDEFLATVSHELRTPLNAILGWSAMLNNDEMDRLTTARGIDSIERNARAQAQLIEDLLDVSRIISGNLRLDIQPISLNSVIKGAVESVQPAATAKDLQLELITYPGNDTVVADASRLQQVIWNLLSNSIKFTPAGGSVSLKIECLDGAAQVTVTDSGDGISAEFLPYVFDRFKQQDGSITRQHGGLGLGLAIAHHLMEMHGGTIEATSPGPGLGSSFILRMPLAGVMNSSFVTSGDANRVSRLTEISRPIGLPKLDGIRVLIVDDDIDAREMLRVALERFGAEVRATSSAEEAFEALPAFKPDVLVSDIGMPGEDGYAFIRKVRALQQIEGGKVPAIALTGYVRVEERMRALAAGFQMFVPKPVEVHELATVILNLVGPGVGIESTEPVA